MALKQPGNRETAKTLGHNQQTSHMLNISLGGGGGGGGARNNKQIHELYFGRLSLFRFSRLPWKVFSSSYLVFFPSQNQQ